MNSIEVFYLSETSLELFLSKCPLPIHWSHRVCYDDFRAQQ